MIESSVYMFDHTFSLLELMDVWWEQEHLSQVDHTPSSIIYMVILEEEWEHMPERIQVELP